MDKPLLFAPAVMARLGLWLLNQRTEIRLSRSPQLPFRLVQAMEVVVENRYIEDRISELEATIKALSSRFDALQASHSNLEQEVEAAKQTIDYEQDYRMELRGEVIALSHFLFALGRFLERDSDATYPGSMTEVLNAALENLPKLDRDQAGRVIQVLSRWRS
ncbi:hypothetical protein [Azospirillum cavernae]|uniref:hypothetical protein n=1 Tax=Azospirillum cavernae TaxID=2320860 RepID=UPI0011C48021|nr:hypothetical protein [Azospirillum cavernae]